VITTF
jgi:hypothetical protein